MTALHRHPLLKNRDSAAIAPIAKRTILCVQPNEDVRPALELALVKYDLVMVSCALDAIREHNAAAFDGYVLDYWLPDWSGVALCRQIRQTEPHAPICFFTAAERDEQKRRALRAGANVFLHFSVGAPALAARLRTLLHVADSQSLHARVEEERAIQEELMRRAAAARQVADGARERAAAAMERAVQTRARKAFVEAGGNLATFERWWAQSYAGAAANVRIGLEPALATATQPAADPRE
ncbi:MAG TPA: response regulator [Burkholderiales bacterium]|nr:response regulator [Burkholderiales bacterium]